MAFTGKGFDNQKTGFHPSDSPLTLGGSATMDKELPFLSLISSTTK